MNDTSIFPRIPVGDWAESGFDWLTENAGWFFDFLRTVMAWLIDHLVELLLMPTPLVTIAVFAVLALLVRSWQFALGTLVFFSLIVAMGQWEHAMETLALVLVATFIVILVGLPIGIWAARSDTVSAVVKPLLDLMQTLPSFTYLIPAIILFSIGAVPGLFATVIFALPPAIRFTELGIRQVDSETVEAGHAFGATPQQILRGIQIPLATPTIMAGVNQVIMLALSMSVIAGFVGAGGLGEEVVSSISSLNVPKGIEAGLGVVILAVYLDRLTAALGDSGHYPHSLLARLRTRRTSRAAEQASTQASPATENVPV